MVHADIEKFVYAKGKGITEKEKIGEVLYNRGVVNAMLGVEAIRTAQGKFGNKAADGRAGALGLSRTSTCPPTASRRLGFEGMLRPIRITCADHEGARDGRVQQWDGKAVEDHLRLAIRPTRRSPNRFVTDVSAKYAADRKITPRDCAKES